MVLAVTDVTEGLDILTYCNTTPFSVESYVTTQYTPKELCGIE